MESEARGAESAPKGNSKGDGAGNSEPRGRKLGAKAIIEQLKNDACGVIDQVAPLIINGVEETDGAERASLSITAAFNPGGKNSKARFDIDGKVMIPATGMSHETVIHEARDGEKQLKMFAPLGA